MRIIRYGFILLVLVLLQVTILPFLSIGEVIPDVLLIGIVLLSVREGSIAGMIGASITGLLRDAFSTGFLGASMLALVVVAFVTGLLREYVPRLRAQSQMSSLLLLIALYYILYYFLLLFNRGLGVVKLLFWFAFPAALYTFFIAAIVHFLIPRGIWGRP